MPTIHVSIKNRMAEGDGSVIICNNNDYTVAFLFDEEWAALPLKTMHILYSNGQYNEVVFEGDTAPLPMIVDESRIKISVYAGDLRTSTGATFSCLKTIPETGEERPAPSVDVYHQITAMINEGTTTCQQQAQQARSASEQARSANEQAQQCAADAAQSAEQAANRLLNGVSTHDQDASAHADLRQQLQSAEAIAKGKATARVFDTYEAMTLWLSDAANTALLTVGDNLYIRALSCPDYWWDGTTIQQLEVESPNLTDYCMREEIESRLPVVLTQAQYDTLAEADELVAGRIYYVVPDGEDAV